MNTTEKNTSGIPWVKVILVIAVVAAVAIFSGRAGLEELFNLEPGTLGGTTNQQSDSQASDSEPYKLKRNGDVLESPQGLTYYVGDRGENRLDHVMRHAKDIPDRGGSHGVFYGDQDKILRTIDEAYALIKADSDQVISRKKGDKRPTSMAYEVDMKRKIGFKGGQDGKRAGNPDLKTLKLILDKGTRVITAYPYR